MTGLFQYQGFGVLSEWDGQIESASAQTAMQQIAATGANSIEIVPRIWTSTTSSDVVISDPAKTESDASLIQGIQNAHHDGLSVILKPNISTLDGHGSSSLAPSDVAAFFASYKAEIVHLASIAQQTGVEVFALGNEMSSLSGAQDLPYWTDIIASVRAVYHGELTYAAATDEASKVGFWGQLDTVGVNTYPPLSVPDHPTVADIVNAWSQVPSNPYWAAAFDHMSPVDFLHSLSTQYGKPLLMTEVGYRSMDYGSTITGSWTTSGAMNLQEQADAFAAFFQVWGAQGGSWLQGAEIWQWDLANKASPTGFEVADKPALPLIGEYFHGVGPLLAGDIAALTDDKIAQLAAIGIHTVVATDHDLTIGRAEATAFGANHISLSEPYGAGAQTLTWNADGSLHDIHYDYIKGQGYTAYDVVFDEAGQRVSATYANGWADAWSYNADGSLHEFVRNNIAGQPWTTTDTLYGATGKALSENFYKGTTPVQSETWNADGSVHDIHYVNVSGHLYTDYDVLYGANGKPASASYSNGMSETWTYNADKSLHSIAYAGVTGASYDTYTAGYVDNRQVVQEFGNLNGTEGLRGYADHLTFTISASGGAASTGGGQVFSFAANANTTLTGGGADETFVFRADFGHATITDFVPNEQANTNHDRIAFSSDLFAGVDDVLQHAAQIGSNTVITDPHGDTLALQHVALSHLTSADFLLV